jgi:hypothetical protein
MLLIAWLATNGRWPLPELFGQRLERRARWRQDGAAPVVGRTIVSRPLASNVYCASATVLVVSRSAVRQ